MEFAESSRVANPVAAAEIVRVRFRVLLLQVVGWALLGTNVPAVEYPTLTTLRLLSPELTLPENVEALKRAGVARAEISLVLGHALPWWDDAGGDLSWLPPESAGRVRRAEAALLQERRALWQQQLVGALPQADAERKRREAIAATRGQIAGVLTPDQMAEYEVRSSPAAAKVREWAWGLGIADEKLWWLVDAERERRALQSRTFDFGDRRVSLASDHDAGELVCIRAAMLVLDGPTAAAYLARADLAFFAWERDLREDLDMSPPVALRLYAWRCEFRLAAAELHENRSIPVPQERRAKQELHAELRAKAEALLGPEQFARYFAHECGRWLADEIWK